MVQGACWSGGLGALTGESDEGAPIEGGAYESAGPHTVSNRLNTLVRMFCRGRASPQAIRLLSLLLLRLPTGERVCAEAISGTDRPKQQQQR